MNNDVIYYRVISRIFDTNDTTYVYNIKNKLCEICDWYYPNFGLWFNKVIKGINTKERIIITAECDNKFIGILVAKHTEDEDKICTLWVDPKFRKQGIAKKLLTRSSKFFVYNPIISISDYVINDFTTICSKYCTFIEKRDDEYKEKYTEYYYKVNLHKLIIPMNSVDEQFHDIISLIQTLKNESENVNALSKLCTLENKVNILLYTIHKDSNNDKF